MEHKDWKTIEAEYRLARMLLYTLKEMRLLDENEVSTVEERLLADEHPLIGELEHDMQ